MNEQLPPRILQIVGLAIVLGSGVFWLITGRQSVEFLSAGMTLITLGSFWNGAPRPPTGHDYELPPGQDKPPANGKPPGRNSGPGGGS